MSSVGNGLVLFAIGVGAMSVTVIEMVEVDNSAPFFAEIVKGVLARATVGVPEMTPSLKVKPAGSAGDIDQDSIAPPEFVAVGFSVRGELRLNIQSVFAKVIIGAISLTVIERVAEEEPVMFLAVTV